MATKETHETPGEREEREGVDWRGTYRLDYERDADTGRIKELRLTTPGGELFGPDEIVVSATPDGFLYLGASEE